MDEITNKLGKLSIKKKENNFNTIYNNFNKKYYAGFYLIWKDMKVIFSNYFIFDEIKAFDQYSTENQLWEWHTKDFKINRFSELNESIGNLNSIHFTISDDRLYDSVYSYKDLDILYGYQYEKFKKNYLNELKYKKENEDWYISSFFMDGNIFKSTHDNYNMSNMIKEIDNIIGKNISINNLINELKR